MYNYTKPIRPIFAMYTGPGPNLLLPTLVGYVHHDPRSVHRKMPACILGLLCPIKYTSVGPGPAAYQIYGLNNDGPYTPPRWSLAARLYDVISFLTPAPGTYAPEDCMAIAYEAPPQYSFGVRHHQVRLDNNPAPNIYVLDGMMGKTARSDKPRAPVYSLYGKNEMFSFMWDYGHTPGPCGYGTPNINVYKPRPPVHSLCGKNYPPDDRSSRPGPQSYENEKVWLHKKTAPEFSFGIRHSRYTTPVLLAIDVDC